MPTLIVIQSLEDISYDQKFCKDLHETLKYVDECSEYKKMMKLKKEHTHTHTHTHISLSLSLCTLIFLKCCACTTLSLSLFIFVKNGLDLDQTRMEFGKECFVNLKICAWDRKYAKPMYTIRWVFSISHKCIHCPVSCGDPEGWSGVLSLSPLSLSLSLSLSTFTTCYQSL